MTIDNAVVGRSLGERERVVLWRDVTNYAAAVGETRRVHLDDTCPDGLVAPPVFPVSLTWPVLAGLAERLGDALPRPALDRMVHAGEHLVLHRQVRPGDRVAMSGRVAALRSGRAGARMVLRVDGGVGEEPLFTEHVTVLFRGVECTDGGAAAGEIPEASADPAEGASRWEAQVAVGREVPFVYDGCTGIVFPIHTSVSFARAAGLPDLLVQGTWTLARAVKEVVDREAGSDPSRLREVQCRFTGMVVPPTRIVIEARVPDAAGGWPFGVRDARGATVLEGVARID